MPIPKSKTLKYRREYTKKRYAKQVKAMGAKGKLGAGGRFAAIVKNAKKYGATNPEAVAASIGRKKYGKKKFQALALAGRKRKQSKQFKSIKVK